MEDIIDIIVTETTNTIEITSQASDETIDVNIIDNREDITLNVTPTLVEININSLTGNFGVNWGEISGTLADQTDLNTALGLKADLVGGKVPSSQLPSYVDDVVEVATYSALPITGETGKIYVVLDTNLIYRWSGSAYIEIKDSSAVWGAITGTLSSQTDLQNALNAKFNNPTGDSTQYLNGAGTPVTFPIAGQSGTLVREVRNTTGATLTKGTIVYISGATGNKPTVSKAIATGDSTSAQTFGMCQADISNNSNGYVVCVGDITGLDTSAVSEGVQLYLSSTTAGTYTTTKQVAPAHLVYIGVVTRSHPTQGQIEVKIQNGYELDEIHDVLITSKANNDGLFYESSTSLWKNKSIATVLGYTPEQPLTFSSPLIRTTNAISIQVASASQNGYLSSTDWSTFNGKQAALNGTGFVKISGTTISYDNSTYLTTSSAASTYLPLAGGTLTGAVTGTGLTLNNYLTSYSPSNIYYGTQIYGTSGGSRKIFVVGQQGYSDGFTVDYNGTSFIYTFAGGAATFANSITASSIIKFGGTSSQFLKADGSVDSSTYLTTSSASSTYLAKTGGTLTGSLNGTTAVFSGAVWGQTGYFSNTTADNAIAVVQSNTSYHAVTITATGGSALYATGSVTIAGTLLATGVITAQSGLANGSGQSFTLPSTSGTLALTSQLSSYLPLSGGTLTGALSGTSATFSGNLGIGASASGASLNISFTSATNDAIRMANTNTGGNVWYMGDGSGSGGTAGDFSIAGGASTSVKFKIAAAGAATFSSSVTAGGNLGTSQAYISNVYPSIVFTTNAAIVTTGANPIDFRPNDVIKMRITSDGNVGIGTTSPVMPLNVASSGSATQQFVITDTALSASGKNWYFQSANGKLYIGNSTDSGGAYTGLTDRLIINSSGYVGIGTGSPSYGLDIQSASSTGAYLNITKTGYASAFMQPYNDGVYLGSYNSYPLYLRTNNSTVMTLTTGGNVGIGTTSPNKNSVGRALTVNASSGNSMYELTTADSSTTAYWEFTGTNSSIINVANGYLRFGVNNAEQVRIATNGTLCVGRTTSPSSAYTAAFQEAIAMYINSNGNNMINWFNASGTYVSSIVINSSTVMYNTVSDYRLKEDLKSFKGLDLVSKINVYDYKWKSDGTRMYGVVAHELQEVLPDAVSGYKDAINPDGTIKNQGVDYSKIVPVMVQAIKDLKAELDTLKNK